LTDPKRPANAGLFVWTIYAGTKKTANGPGSSFRVTTEHKKTGQRAGFFLS